MLTDPDGLVLNRVCSERFLLQALDDVRLAPGFDFSERKTGTTGLGLALADRVPTLVRADQHYSTSLWGYTCAAVPVADPVTGAMVGAVNLTTWSQQSYNLLLALAQTAARTTEALMLARGRGRETRPATRGRVVRVRTAVDDDSAPCLEDLGVEWRAAMDVVRAACARARAWRSWGSPASARATLLGGAHARTHRGRRVLHARPPEPEGVASWLALWSPELGKPGTSDRLRRRPAPGLGGRRPGRPRGGAEGAAGLAVTARDAAEVPDGLRAAVGTVVELPALRYRPGDVVPLASWFAVRLADARSGSPPTPSTPSRPTTGRATSTSCARSSGRPWRAAPRLRARSAAGDLHRRPPQAHPMETLERDEIVRALSEPGATAASAAESLGMSRSTIYRRIAKYGIRAPAGADQKNAHPPTESTITGRRANCPALVSQEVLNPPERGARWEVHCCPPSIARPW